MNFLEEKIKTKALLRSNATGTGVLVSYLTGNIYATASHKSVISPTASGKSLAISPTAKNGKNVTRDA